MSDLSHLIYVHFCSSFTRHVLSVFFFQVIHDFVICHSNIEILSTFQSFSQFSFIIELKQHCFMYCTQSKISGAFCHPLWSSMINTSITKKTATAPNDQQHRIVSPIPHQAFK